MIEMHESFAFVDAGRTFTCTVETPRRPLADAWWWFEVGSADRQRYAPFRAEATDTPDGVRSRVIAYYADLLARRAEPVQRRWQRGRTFGSAASPSVVAPLADIADAPAVSAA